MVSTIKNIIQKKRKPVQLTEGLPPGTKAPDFTLPATNGKRLSLNQLQGRPVVLAFYPADETPVCSNQLALYNESLHLFDAFNAQLLGISIDDLDSHHAFASSLDLQFPLLADDDPEGAVADRYGVLNPADGKCDRALYVIDPEGNIRWRSVSPRGTNPGAHGILDALEAMM